MAAAAASIRLHSRKPSEDSRISELEYGRAYVVVTRTRREELRVPGEMHKEIPKKCSDLNTAFKGIEVKVAENLNSIGTFIYMRTY